jgi:hypothetical protein
VLVLFCVAALIGFAWLRLTVRLEFYWLTSTPNPGNRSVSRQTTDDAGRPITVRDVWSQTTFFTARLEQEYDPAADDWTSRAPRNGQLKYRPAFWIIVVLWLGAVAVPVAVLWKAMNRIPRPPFPLD